MAAKSCLSFRQLSLSWRAHFFAAFLAILLALSPLVGQGQDSLKAETYGHGELLDMSIVEGSSQFGGAQPDFLIDTQSPAFTPLFEFARKLKEEGLSPTEKATKLIEYIRAHVFLNSGSSEEYKRVSNEYLAAKKPIPLSKLIEIKSGVCREHSYVLHLGLKEAGVPNRVVYNYVNPGYQAAPGGDHSFVVYNDHGTSFIADAFYHAFHGRKLEDVVLTGAIAKFHLFPKYSADKSRLEKEQIPLDKLLSPDEFKKLLFETIQKIPDLEPLWNWVSKNHVSVFIGGGILRGVLNHIYKTVKDYGLEGFKKIPVPSTDALLLLPGSDRDLYVASERKEDLRSALPTFAGWDFSPLEAYEDNMKAGGSTIDKILVSPHEVKDFYKGLEAFYHGHLDYLDLPAEQIENTFWFKERGNSKIAMILRLLRMNQDLPMLRIPEVTSNIIRKAIHEELPKLESKHARWIEKGLGKLFASTGYRPESVLKVLKQFGLLEGLATKGFRVKLDAVYPIDFDDLKLLGFAESEIRLGKLLFSETMMEPLAGAQPLPITDSNQSLISIKDLKAKFSSMHNLEERANVIASSMPSIRTASEFVEMFDFTEYPQSSVNHIFLGEMIITHLDHFFRLNPSVQDAKALIVKNPYSEDAYVEIVTRMAKRIRNPNDFIDLVKSKAILRIDSHVAISKAIEASLARFFSMKPNVDAILNLINLSSKNRQLQIKIAEASVRFLKTPSEYITIFTKPFRYSTNRDALIDAVDRSIFEFYALKPTLSEADFLMDSFTTRTEFPKFSYTLISSFLADCKSVHEITNVLFHYYPYDERRASRDQWRQIYKDLFYTLVTAPPHTKNGIRSALSKATSKDEFSKILEIDDSLLIIEGIQKFVRDEWFNSLKFYVTLNPTTAEMAKVYEKLQLKPVSVAGTGEFVRIDEDIYQVVETNENALSAAITSLFPTDDPVVRHITLLDMQAKLHHAHVSKSGAVKFDGVKTPLAASIRGDLQYLLCTQLW